MSSNEQAILWKNRISEQQASGLTITGWCQAHTARYRQFHYWKKRLLADSHKSNPKAELFAEIPVSAKMSRINKPQDRIHLSFHDAEIDIPECFHPDTLLGLMKILQQL